MMHILLLAIGLIVSGCGSKYCVAGIGQCEEMFDEASRRTYGPTTQGGSTADSLLLTPANGPEVELGFTKIIEISGGTKPYKCSLEGDGEVVPVGDAATSTKCEFKTLKESDKKSAIITVQDAKNKKASVAIIIN